MNILLISRCPPYPLHFGDRLIVYHLARELSQRGHVIDLLAFSNRVEDLAERGEYAAFFRSVTLVPEPPRPLIDYARRVLKLRPRFASTPDQAWSPEMARLIREKRTQNHYDLAHLFGGVHVYEYAPLVGDLPALITPYESYALYLRRQLENASSLRARLSSWLMMRLARAFESFMFDPYCAAVVVSPLDRDELMTINPALNVQVIPNGIDLDSFPFGTDERDPRRLLFTGNFEYAPNVDAAKRLITQILPQVQARIPDVSLWIVGNAPPPDLQALASDRVIVTGRVPDLSAYLRGAAVYIAALRLGAGIKNKVLEALASGIPVIGTPVSMDGIAVTDGENALIAATDAQIAAAAIRLLENAALRDQIGAAGRRLIESRYTWSAAAAAYEELYKTCAS